MSDSSTETSAGTPRLARRLGTGDAVVVGLGSMIGAGVFAAVGPAAKAAGGGLLIGLALAALVAYCNATSSAQLAALYPESGGTYVYGRRRLGPFWGYLAGWGFVVGKTASCAAMALTFGAYVAPAAARPLAVAAVVAATALNLRGIQRTAAATRVVVALVLASLAAALAAALLGGQASVGRLDLGSSSGPYGILQAAGLFFFAFAGYARIATLGRRCATPSGRSRARSRSPSGSRWSSTSRSRSPRSSRSGRSGWPRPRPRWRTPRARAATGAVVPAGGAAIWRATLRGRAGRTT